MSDDDGNEESGSDTQKLEKLEAEISKWKDLAKKHETRAKENAEAAERVKELEEEGQSELERLTSRLKEAESKATDAERRAMRLEVALDKGLTKVQAKRLVGDTQEELEQDADDLLESFQPPKGNADEEEGAEGDKGDGLRRPSEKLKPGATGTSEDNDGDEPSIKEVLAEVPRL